eukprot:5333491-Lingulodinium_polyedra.AAC.1
MVGGSAHGVRQDRTESQEGRAHPAHTREILPAIAHTNSANPLTNVKLKPTRCVTFNGLLTVGAPAQ